MHKRKKLKSKGENFMNTTMVTVKVFNAEGEQNNGVSNAEVTLVDRYGLRMSARTNRDGEVDFDVVGVSRPVDVEIKHSGAYFVKRRDVIFADVGNHVSIGLNKAPLSFPVTLNTAVKVPGLEGTIEVIRNRREEQRRGEDDVRNYEIRGNNIAVISSFEDMYYEGEGSWNYLTPFKTDMTLRDVNGLCLDIRLCDEGPGMISLGYDQKYTMVKEFV